MDGNKSRHRQSLADSADVNRQTRLNNSLLTLKEHAGQLCMDIDEQDELIKIKKMRTKEKEAELGLLVSERESIIGEIERLKGEMVDYDAVLEEARELSRQQLEAELNHSKIGHFMSETIVVNPLLE